MLTTIDKFGRVLIPKKFRDHLGIKPNSSMNIKDDGERIIIEPIPGKNGLVNKNGLLIFVGKCKNNLDQEVESSRVQRSNNLLFSGD